MAKTEGLERRGMVKTREGERVWGEEEGMGVWAGSQGREGATDVPPPPPSGECAEWTPTPSTHTLTHTPTAEWAGPPKQLCVSVKRPSGFNCQIKSLWLTLLLVFWTQHEQSEQSSDRAITGRCKVHWGLLWLWSVNTNQCCRRVSGDGFFPFYWII